MSEKHAGQAFWQIWDLSWGSEGCGYKKNRVEWLGVVWLLLLTSMGFAKIIPVDRLVWVAAGANLQRGDSTPANLM
jgi:hypothetical protein